MKRVLIISHSDPFGIGGGCFACHAYVKAFADYFNGEADICIPAESKNKVDATVKYRKILRVPQRKFLSRALSIFSGDIQRNTSFVRELLRQHPNEYTHAVINGCRESGALIGLLKQNNIKVITVFHNYEPEYFRDNCKYPVYREICLHHITNLEKKAYLNSDLNLFLTNQDKAKFEQVYGAAESLSEVLGVFEYSDIENPSLQDFHSNLKYVITGSLCTMQGVDGVMYYLDNLHKFLPSGSTVTIAGREPKKELIEKCAEFNNVNLIANPVNISEVISGGDVYICPTRLGGGLKLRIMDGLKLGLPVVTHNCSARGYDMFFGDNSFYSFSTPEEFRDSILRLEASIKKQEISKVKVFNRYITAFSFNAGLNRVKQFMKDL